MPLPLGDSGDLPGANGFSWAPGTGEPIPPYGPLEVPKIFVVVVGRVL